MKISGIAIRGDGRGRELGFPTANLELDNPTQRPAEGVYAGWAEVSGKIAGGTAGGAPDSELLQRRLGESAVTGPAILKATIHIGPVPTFNKQTPTVEVHLLDFPDQDLYGEKMTVELVKKIADIKKFNSVDELKARIQKNCDEARKLLQNDAELPPS